MTLHQLWPTLQVALPDLVVAGVSDPPQTAEVGTKFVVFDNSVNMGPVSTSASTTRYFLSKDNAKGAGDVLVDSRPVPVLSTRSARPAICRAARRW